MPDRGESGWIVEQGIGETRAVLLEKGEVTAAKLIWPGEMRAGSLVRAKLTARKGGAARGTATTEAGLDVLVSKLPRAVSEGATIAVAITRPAMAERGRLKRAQGKWSDLDPASLKAQADASMGTLITDGKPGRIPAGLWEEVWNAAWEGEVSFPGGTLLFSVTPAMMLIDVDGDGSPRELALAAVPAIARALRLFDMGGSIGIDFPTIAEKAGRKAVDAALDEALADWPHERTAVNGFGFVQIVARLEGPSLLHRMATSRVGAAARMALHRAERVEGPGVTLLTVHPALKAKLKQHWLDELVRRTGRPVRLECNPALALGAAQAQIVPHD